MLTLLLPVSNAGPGGRLCYEGATASSLETAILKGKWEGGRMERERGGPLVGKLVKYFRNVVVKHISVFHQRWGNGGSFDWFAAD